MLKALLLALLMVPTLARASGPAHVDIVGEVDYSTAGAVETAVKHAQEDKTSIEIFIDSPGGSVFQGFRILNALNTSGVPVVCTVGDLAASMAAVILEAGCSKRIVHESSIVMFHQASAATNEALTEATASDMLSILRAINLSMAVRVAKRLGLTIEQYAAKAIGREWWVVGVEAVTLKVADEVIPAPGPTPL